MELEWRYNSFDELTTYQLYAILRLRNEVFVVEQNCAYQDADGKDEISYHVTGWDEGILVAYCRVLPPNISFSEASIGRVIISSQYRHFGYGRVMMELAVAYALQLFRCRRITISAQLYLLTFYASIGFIKMSETYLEDNIPHIKMQLTV